jgi:hypothetical protein
LDTPSILFNTGLDDSTSYISPNVLTTEALTNVVPYGFNATRVENTRTLNRTDVLYSVCLPYSLSIPEGAIVYRLNNSYPNELVFTQTTETMEAGMPYLVRSTGDIGPWYWSPYYQYDAG